MREDARAWYASLLPDETVRSDGLDEPDATLDAFCAALRDADDAAHPAGRGRVVPAARARRRADAARAWEVAGVYGEGAFFGCLLWQANTRRTSVWEQQLPQRLGSTAVHACI